MFRATVKVDFPTPLPSRTTLSIPLLYASIFGNRSQIYDTFSVQGYGFKCRIGYTGLLPLECHNSQLRLRTGQQLQPGKRGGLLQGFVKNRIVWKGGIRGPIITTTLKSGAAERQRNMQPMAGKDYLNRALSGLGGFAQDNGVEQQEQTPPRERGGTRRRLMGYLKAANDLRQSYYSGYANRSSELDLGGSSLDSEWPGIGVVTSGEEELLLFPSYARWRLRDLEETRGDSGMSTPLPGTTEQQNTTRARSGSLAQDEPGYQVDDASTQLESIVDVDVRGWLYTPHSGPLSRKNRYLLWLARQLCGLPAVQTPPVEESGTSETTEVMSSEPDTRPASIPPDAEAGDLQRVDSMSSGGVGARLSAWRPGTFGVGITGTTHQQQQQQQQQPQMTPAEVSVAHRALNARLAPFMHRPIAQAKITIFFYNSTNSESRCLLTPDSGHFRVRASLSFVPTHIRILASEKISFTEEVKICDPRGVSLISDIDDTVKHSAVSLGAREIFRNTFTAPISNMSIPGVAQWYKTLAAPPLNVNLHYVSNSPWQLYPLLKEFFQESGMPGGSFHLKQYSGMLQGIFEPIADRKRKTVEGVIGDFPLRRWILVGDSGEMDLEIYTEIAEKWSEKVIAVFIRDITTTSTAGDRGFFYSNEKIQVAGKDKTGIWGAGAVEQWAPKESATPPKVPPKLPPKSPPKSKDVPEGILIDLSDEKVSPNEKERPPIVFESHKRDSSVSSINSASSLLSPPTRSDLTKTKTPPPKPVKPRELRASPLGHGSGSSTAPSLPATPPEYLERKNLNQRFGNATFADAIAEESAKRASLYDGSEYGPPSPNPPPLPRARTASIGAMGLGLNGGLAGYPLGGQTPDPQGFVLSKKEELWKRRWEAAERKLESRGIPLRSWRVGEDVEAECRMIVEKALMKDTR
ncbi:hypothetical protein RUND412_000389 [Rhizina undulata]